MSRELILRNMILDKYVSLRQFAKEIDKMIFFHNNGVIVKDFEGAKQKVEKLFEGKAVISYDGLCLDM